MSNTPRRVTDEYHMIRQQLDINDRETLAEMITEWVMDHPDIGEASDYHAKQVMKQLGLTIPDDTSDCGIYWSLLSEYHVQLLLQVIQKLSPHQ